MTPVTKPKIMTVMKETFGYFDHAGTGFLSLYEVTGEWKNGETRTRWGIGQDDTNMSTEQRDHLHLTILMLGDQRKNKGEPENEAG